MLVDQVALHDELLDVRLAARVAIVRVKRHEEKQREKMRVTIARRVIETRV